MPDESKSQNFERRSNLSDHMSNERTFLAWVRTGMGIMAFGFVVERFALFLEQIASFFGKSNLETTSSLGPEYSSFFGIFLVILGTLISVLAFFKFRKIGKQIEENTYHLTILLEIMLTLSVFLIGIFLAIYLIISI